MSLYSFSYLADELFSAVLCGLSITTSWEVGKAKPSKEIFAAAARKLGVSPRETIMVGDDFEEDYKGAIEAGLQSVLLHRPRHDADYVRVESNEEDLQNVKRIASLEDLPSLLKSQSMT